MNPVVLVGATASGKSAVALELAAILGGEIVNADSRQVYRLLDAGTAKPSPEDFAKVPHHLYDFLSPKEAYNAGRYARDAARALDDIAARGKAAVVVGGTGLYLRALFDGLSPLPPRDEGVRRALLRLAEEGGRRALHARLAEVDPASAAKIPFQNIQRTARALEVYEVSGRPLSEWQKAAPPAGRAQAAAGFFGLEWDGAVLKERIALRSQSILPGMIEEARRLLEAGFQPGDPGLESLGYRGAVRYLRGELDYRELLTALMRDTQRYAKRQRTWFRADARIRWLEVCEPFDPKSVAENIFAIMKK